jgi:hypothetical protein
MLKAVESRPPWAGLVKCALVVATAIFAAVLWFASPAQAQEQVVCGPADTLKDFLEGHGLKKTAETALMDGDLLEAWESASRIAVTVLVKDAEEPTRCLVRTMGVNRRSKGA